MNNCKIRQLDSLTKYEKSRISKIQSEISKLIKITIFLENRLSKLENDIAETDRFIVENRSNTKAYLKERQHHFEFQLERVQQSMKIRKEIEATKQKVIENKKILSVLAARKHIFLELKKSELFRIEKEIDIQSYDDGLVISCSQNRLVGK